MNFLDFSSSLTINDESCITIGSFDGFHLAHKFLINLTLKMSKFLNMKSLIFTFVEHPHLNRDLILTKEEKLEMIKNFGFDYLILLKRDIFDIKSEDFLRILKHKYKVKWIVIGYNHRFGNNREGDRMLLSRSIEDFGFGLTIVPPIDFEGIEISSSNIRRLIKDGNIDLANKLLGYNYFIRGEVIKGKGLGKKLGFPTINIKFNQEKLIPKQGVYLSKVFIREKAYYSATYVNQLIESYIFDFNEEIYGELVKVEFIKFISEAKKFDNLDDLKKKIEKDVNIALNFLSEQPL
ncbi:MAG: bifunctional riboflavin kinase/FAD synthetase [candidate division WOR-3 bacterium]